MLILNVNPLNNSRISLLFNYWGKDFIKLYPKSIFKLGSSSRIPFLNQFSLKFDYNNSIYNIQNLLLHFYDAVNDFLYNSTCDWMVRTTEDCFIDSRKLFEYFNNLNRVYNPKVDKVFKGQLIKASKKLSFLHGGSGWILSRASAEFIIKFKQDILNKYFSSYIKGDDVVTYDFINYCNINFNEVDSRVFLGTPFNEETIQILQSKQYQNFPKCNFSNNYFFFKNIIFWHSGRKDLLPLIEGYQILSNIPNNLIINIFKHNSYLCYI